MFPIPIPLLKDSIQKDPVEGDVPEEEGHPQGGVVRQVVLANLQEASMTGQASQARLKFLLGQRIEHDVHSLAVGVVHDLRTTVTQSKLLFRY